MLIWRKDMRPKLGNKNGAVESEMTLVFRTAAIVVPVLLCLEPAIAQDIAAGKRVAQTSCSGCHEIESRPTPSIGAGPPFRSIARTRGMTQTSIEVFLSTPHEVMPNYVLTRKQIRDVAAYIIELRSKSGPSPTKRKGDQPG